MDLALKIIMTWLATIIMIAMGGIGVGLVIDLGWKGIPFLLLAMGGVGAFGYPCVAIWRDF